MKDLSRSVKLYCNICGNNQFESLDETFANVKEALETVRILNLEIVRRRCLGKFKR